MRLFTLLFCLAFVLGNPESRMNLKANEPDFDEISGWIKRQLDYNGDPGLAVAVVKDGKIIFAKGFGWADKEKRHRANEHTAYSIASISKPITATGIQILAQADKINVDRPANDYLGKVKVKNPFGESDAITVRNLLNRMCGLAEIGRAHV